MLYGVPVAYTWAPWTGVPQVSNPPGEGVIGVAENSVVVGWMTAPVRREDLAAALPGRGGGAWGDSEDPVT